MATAFTPLANITLTGTPANVTFSSISQSYRDLLLVIVTTGGSGSQYLNFTLNSDSGANYSDITAYGSGSSAASYSGSGGTWINLPNLLSAGVNNYLVHIMDYSATDKHKTVLSRANATGDNVAMQANRWASTSGVTTIQFFPETGGTFTVGCTFALYGVSS